ncbi:hypothetical protein GCM10017750_00310 [Streptomyces racemochromogenes]
MSIMVTAGQRGDSPSSRRRGRGPPRQLTGGPGHGHGQSAAADCADEASSSWPGGDGGCGADFLMWLGWRNAHGHPGLGHLHRELEGLCPRARTLPTVSSMSRATLLTAPALGHAQAVIGSGHAN